MVTCLMKLLERLIAWPVSMVESRYSACADRELHLIDIAVVQVAMSTENCATDINIAAFQTCKNSAQIESSLDFR